MHQFIQPALVRADREICARPSADSVAASRSAPANTRLPRAGLVGIFSHAFVRLIAHRTRTAARGPSRVGSPFGGKRRVARPLNKAVTEGIRRIEDIATGRVEGLTEEQYRAAMQ